MSKTSTDTPQGSIELSSDIAVQSEWFLGFDASCRTCADLAGSVSDASNGYINTVSLHAPVVASWRAQALGPDAPWLPTLFRINGNRVEAWTGKRMVARMARLLGPRRAWQLAEALGAASAPMNPPSVDEVRFGRRKALVGLSGIAAGLILASSGVKGAMAAPELPPEDCGLTDFHPEYVDFYTVAAGANCRKCPYFNGAVDYSYGAYNHVYFKGYTLQGDPVNGDPQWFRTSGRLGCWVASEQLTS